MDERFIMHRYKATRVAMMVGVILMGFFFWYEYVSNRMVRWDLLLVMGAMTVAKVGVMLYYRRTN
jgi:uncharacterized protein (DUF983 family)